VTSQVPAGSIGPESDEQPCDRVAGPVHEWFGGSGASFLVAQRARLQSMPLEWQQRFAELFGELRAAYADEPDPDFDVTTVAVRCVEELSQADIRLLGITVTYTEQDEGPSVPCFTDRMGNELDGGFRVEVPVADPIPDYRGAFLRPDEAAIAGLRAARQLAGAGPGGDTREAAWSELSASWLDGEPPSR
jgi:hypothetical protein